MIGKHLPGRAGITLTDFTPEIWCAMLKTKEGLARQDVENVALRWLHLPRLPVSDRVSRLHRDGVSHLVAEEVSRLIRLAVKMPKTQRRDEAVRAASCAIQTAAKKKQLAQGCWMKRMSEKFG